MSNEKDDDRLRARAAANLRTKILEHGATPERLRDKGRDDAARAKDLGKWFASEVLPAYLQGLMAQGRAGEMLGALEKGASLAGALDAFAGMSSTLSSCVADFADGLDDNKGDDDAT